MKIEEGHWGMRARGVKGDGLLGAIEQEIFNVDQIRGRFDSPADQLALKFVVRAVLRYLGAKPTDEGLVLDVEGGIPGTPVDLEMVEGSFDVGALADAVLARWASEEGDPVASRLKSFDDGLNAMHKSIGALREELAGKLAALPTATTPPAEDAQAALAALTIRVDGLQESLKEVAAQATTPAAGGVTDLADIKRALGTMEARLKMVESSITGGNKRG